MRTVPKHPADWGQDTALIQPQRAWMIKQKDNRAVWRFQQHILYNLTHAELSVQLLAPLAKKAGGYGACREISRTARDGETITDKIASVFASKDDPDYQRIIKVFDSVMNEVKEKPRMDMVQKK